jgi:PTS hybrid protein
MVSLVLIGHSPDLLRGLRAMIAQTAGAVPVAVAGGTAIGNLGTSSPTILAALRTALTASGGSGTVVLFDLGSAFMALELALEELRASERALVRVSAGPLVEGAVLAAVEALSGAPLDRVLAVADGAAAVAKLPAGWPDDEDPPWTPS